MTMSHLEALFEHHVWANLRLLAFCAEQDDAVLDAPMVAGTFASIRETWVHLLANEQGYLQEAMKPVAPWITVEPELFADRTWKGFDYLKEVAREAGQTWLRLVRELPDGTILEEEVDGERVRMLASVVLVQVIDHGTEHRTHIKTCLTQQGIEPPSIDSWAWGEETTPGL
jgi:uncharacterized damage-inducible protein DinB